MPLPEMVAILRAGAPDLDVGARATAHQIRRFFHARGVACSIETAQTALGQLWDQTPATRPATTGTRLAARRHELGLNLTNLAALAGVSPGYISYLEGGRRSPSPATLDALAAALEVEAQWLESGESSIATQRIAERLQFAEYASEQGDHAQAVAAIESLLAESLARDLAAAERDRADLLLARALYFVDRAGEGVDLLRRLVRRCVAGDSALSILEVTQPLVRMLMDAAGDPLVAAEAIHFGEQALALAPRDVRWWRLAATVIGVQSRAGHFTAATIQGRRWLEELEPGDDDPSTVLGYAGLLWNLAEIDEILGRHADALVKITKARELHSPSGYLVDNVRVHLEYVTILLSACPHRAAEADALLTSLHDEVHRVGHAQDIAEWYLQAARSAAIMGNTQDALRLLDQINPAGSRHRVAVRAFLLAADLHASVSHQAAARAACTQAAELLGSAPATPEAAMLWRQLADHLDLTGAPTSDVIGAYRAALACVELGPSDRWLSAPPVDGGSGGQGSS